MFRNVLAATAVAVMAGTAIAADYSFPSANPPAGKSADEVIQMVSYIWDDNGYSGELGTQYEYKTGEITWADRATVGGTDGAKNPLTINEGDMGISWAVKGLGSKLGGGHMTFNMISGLFVPTWGPQWYNRQSEYGSYNNGTAEGNTWIVAAANGREQAISATTKGATDVQKSFMVEGVKKMIQAGHELGNHTLDHIETNSPYPKAVFDKFGMGEGFDDGSVKQDILGNPFDEAVEFGSEGAALTMGWKAYAGKGLSEAAWFGIIKAGEEPTENYVTTDKMYGFRAPRLEVNSNLFFALDSAGYLYDCGLEEGYEEHVDGTNFLWPYTTDNGGQNVWTQKEWGETVYIDSMPAGLWQYPVNVMIVPEGDRSESWEHYNAIAQGAGDEYIEPKDEWTAVGKITGFDFNMFILWGMTGPAVQRTLENSLDLRMSGNKAPMHIGCHTDYFTPIYDYATLMSDFNKNSYGLVVSNNWNTWTDRKTAWEGFAQYAVGKGAKFMSGKEVIDQIKQYQESEQFGQEKAYTGMTWDFGKNDALNSSTASESISGDIDNVTISVDAASGDNYPEANFASYEGEGFYDGLTHISLDYKTTAPLSLRLYVEGDKSWEVLLNNVNYDAQSGKIPLSAFHYNQYDVGTNSSIDTKKITGISIQPLTTGNAKEDVTFSAKNFKLYGASMQSTAVSSTVASTKGFATLKGITNSAMQINVGTSGLYNVEIFTANGRLVRSINNQNLSADAVNTVNLNNLPSGIYMMKISGQNKAEMLKAMVM